VVENFGPDLPLLFKLHKIWSVILRKIIKTGVTRCQIFMLKCTKCDFGCGSAPDPAGGAYSAPPAPLAGLGGPTSKGRGGVGRRVVRRGGGGEEEGAGEGKDVGRGLGRGRGVWKGKGEEVGRGWKGEEGKGKGWTHLSYQ